MRAAESLVRAPSAISPGRHDRSPGSRVVTGSLTRHTGHMHVLHIQQSCTPAPHVESYVLMPLACWPGSRSSLRHPELACLHAADFDLPTGAAFQSTPEHIDLPRPAASTNNTPAALSVIPNYLPPPLPGLQHDP